MLGGEEMKIKEHIRAIAADLYLGEQNLIATSSETGYGKFEVLKKIRAIIDEAKNEPYVEEEEELEQEQEENS